LKALSVVVLSLAIFLVWAGPLHAATVVVVWPKAPSAEVTQALTLLRGELLSVGLEVVTADEADVRGAGGARSAAWLEALAARGASAILDPITSTTPASTAPAAPLTDAGLEAVDVWIVKTHPQRFEVTHVAVDPHAPAQPEMLALRAVEALRAGLLQIDWAARKRRSELVEKPTPVPAPAVQAPAPREIVGLELGAVAVMGLDGLGPAVSPTVSMGWLARPSLLLQTSAAGLGSRSSVATTAGNAQVGQQYLVVGARYRLRTTQRLWPFLGLAAGALHTSVEGETGAGTRGHTQRTWSGLVDVSLGAGFRLAGRTYLTLAAHAQVAEPYVAIHILDTVAATAGRPNLLLTLTVGAWL
jgi:hypothetical protein